MINWRPFPNFPDYSISDCGLVKTKNGRISNGGADKNGYRTFHIGAIRKTFKIHRLVAEIFIGPIPEGMQINHKNGIKHDNRVENLEIVTPSENLKHSFRVLGRKSENMGQKNQPKGTVHFHAKFTDNDIREIFRLAHSGVNGKRIAAIYSTNQTNISAILRRAAWKHVVDENGCAIPPFDSSCYLKQPKRGEESGAAKLTESEVQEIRRLYATGIVQTELARRFHVGQNTISRIILRKTWAHVA